MHPFLASTIRAFSFLTRLPYPNGAFTGDHPLGADAPAFPVVGLLAALPSAALILLGDTLGLSAPVVAVMGIGLLVFVTGGLHEDGLGDVADGLGGHHPKERALLIMKDSRIGAYGALALIVSLGLRTALLAEIVAEDAATAGLVLLASAAASRGAMAWLWSSLPSADPGGLADRLGRPNAKAGRRAGGLGAAILVVPALFALGPAAAFLPGLLGLLALGQFRGFIVRRLGGQTGDCLGAAQQITEIALLIGFAVALS